MRRSLMVVILALAALATALVVPSSTADAQGTYDPAAEARFVELVNAERAAAGLPPLAVHSELQALARGWTDTQAAAGEIFHADPISQGLTANWLKLGENVGTGPDVDPVMDAFVASPGHYANIVDPEFAYIGVGVVWVGPRMFTTHRFMKLDEAPAPPPPPPPPPPAPEPAPTPAPAPQPAPAPEPAPAPAPAPEPAPEPAPAPTTTSAPAPEPEAVPLVRPDVDRVARMLAVLHAVEA